MKPKLSQEQKACLIQEVLEWAISNVNIMCPESPRLQVLDVLEAIQLENPDKKASANNQNIFVRQLKQNGILWGKVVPFLQNDKGGCLSRIPEGITYGDKCTHNADEHVDGKCDGVHFKEWVQVGEDRYHHRRNVPCPCTKYKSNQTW